MPQLNANIPYQCCYVRNKLLFNNNDNDFTECYIFGVKSIINRPLLFHCQLQNGAVFWSLPISAFVWKKDYVFLGENEQERLSNLQWWDCQSNDISVTCFSYLQNYKVEVISRNNKEWMEGKYLFTIDDYYADLNSLPLGYATDSDSKCFHFIRLNNGNFCVYPNNFCRWHNLNFVDPYETQSPPKYKPNIFDLNSEFEVNKCSKDENN